MRLVRTHRIVSFTQRPFMRQFVEHCNEQRQNAEAEFESALYKLLPNSFFRKDLRESAKARQCETRERSEETRHGRGQSHLQALHNNKFQPGPRGVDASPHNDESPLAVGFTILELSKLIMYSAYYEQLLPRYGDDLRLCFTDTDSFIFWVKTPDLHADMADMRSTFMDTPNFSPGHPLYSDKNKRKLGFFKLETGPYFPSQFCGLRSKMYSLWTPTSDDPAHTFTKAKGVPKHYVKKRVRHEQYLHVLRGWNTTSCTFRTFRSKNHAIATRKLSTICLSCIDSKYRLSSIHDRHIFDSLRVTMAWFFDLNMETMIEPPPKSTVYYFMEYQLVLDEYPQIDFLQGVPTVRELGEARDTLVVCDDMMMESNDALLNDFTCGSHHRRNSVIHSVQNLFNSNKNMTTMSLNAQYLVFFKSSRDSSQFVHLARQTYPHKSRYAVEAYKFRAKHTPSTCRNEFADEKILSDV